MKHNDIGTEHILLGLVREKEGVARRSLLDFDADPEKVRNTVIRMLSGSLSEPKPGGESPRSAVDEAWLDGLGPVLDQLVGEIRGKLGRTPNAGDLLLALACAPETLPGRVLGDLGIDLAQAVPPCGGTHRPERSNGAVSERRRFLNSRQVDVSSPSSFDRTII